MNSFIDIEVFLLDLFQLKFPNSNSKNELQAPV